MSSSMALAQTGERTRELGDKADEHNVAPLNMLYHASEHLNYQIEERSPG